MRGRFGKSAMSAFTFTKSNRIGSDELICVKKSTSDPMEELRRKSAHLLASVERLQRELERKELEIGRLTRELRERETKKDSVDTISLKSKGWRRYLTKSASSIKILSDWFTNKSARTIKVSKDSIHEQKITNRNHLCGLTSSSCSLGVNLPGETQHYTYDILISDLLPLDQLRIERLERYLDEDSLLEHLGVCVEFLPLIGRAELEERKYRAMLTGEQYRVFRHAIDQ